MNKGLLVDKVEGYELSASEPDAQTDAITFQIKGGLETVNLSELSSGSVSGYARFTQETLSNLGQRLNNIVTVMVEEINKIQTAGLDGFGREGEEFFVLEPGIEIDKGASRGDYDVTPAIRDLAQISNGVFSFTYDLESNQWIPDPGQARSLDFALGVPGLEFSIAGTPLDGDRFIVNVFDDAASGIRMGIEDGQKIAAASLFRVTPGINNVGALQPVVSFESPNPSELEVTDAAVTVSATASEPVRIVEAGKSDVTIKLDPDNASSLSIDVITRDGRHLVGGSDSAGLGAVVSQSSFFSAGASYSSSYINLDGAAEGSYKDLVIKYGAFGETNEQTRVFPLPLDAVDAPVTTDFAGGFIDFTSAAVEKVNLLLAEDDAVDQTDGAISIVNDVIYRGTGSGSEQVGTVTYPYGVSNPSFDTLRVNFLSAPVTGINVPILNKISGALTLSAFQGSLDEAHPVIADISVEAVTSDASEQFTARHPFNSTELIRAGRVFDGSRYRSELLGQNIPLFSGNGTVVVQANQLAINGVNLGALTVGASGVEGYGRLSVLDIKTWLDAAAAPDVEVKVRNEIFISPGSVTLSGAGLQINGTDIVSLANGVATVFADEVDVVQSINALSSTGVSATIGLNGEIILGNTNGANIDITSSTGASNANLLGISNGTYAGQYKIIQRSQTSNPLSVEILPGGDAADLNSIGLDTSIKIQGDLDEDLGIFVRGSGSATLSAEQVDSDRSFVAGLRSRVFDLEFTSDTSFSITDRDTGTVVANRTYADELEIEYQGMSIKLDRAAIEGDTFTIDGNNTAPGQAFDAQGNNLNLMRILELESSGIVSGQSLTEAYLDLVGDVGNEATQAEISYDALEVLEAQAIEARDRVSGVSLDREAADLIRFQQAYQASAQIIQIATKIFDDMLRIQ